MAEAAHTGSPTPKLYWMIALVLAVLTAIEVSVPYIDALDSVAVPLLLLLGAIKFLIVVGFFMHLKFDRPIYRNLFFIGVIGALIIFSVVLLALQAF
jgi:cytochrome c oxidase subunit 4